VELCTIFSWPPNDVIHYLVSRQILIIIITFIFIALHCLYAYYEVEQDVAVAISEIFFTVGADWGVGWRVENGFQGRGLSAASPRGLISKIRWMEVCGS
jgi:hypothetical protein